MNIKDSSYLLEWKRRMKELIRMHYEPERISDKRIERYLDEKIEENLTDPGLILVNNYTNKVSRTTLLKLIELIRTNRLIMAGGGCLFLPHDMKKNLLIEFILHIMAARKDAKNKRKLYPKGSDEWAELDRAQLSYKLVINSLYGCLGYPGFIMFNIFLAEAITNQGRLIISTAINCVENFLGDGFAFESPADLFNTIYTIKREYEKRFPDGMNRKTVDTFSASFNTTTLSTMCLNRYIKHCIFKVSDDVIEELGNMFARMDTGMLLLMYFKNNIMQFSRLPFIKAKFKALIEQQGVLMFCEDESFGRGDTDDEKAMTRKMILPILEEIWGFYDVFVHYNYPIYDKLRKAMYLDKGKSLYTDTDSVFISLDEFMQYIMHDVFTSPDELGMTEDEYNFTAANVTLAIVNRAIDASMKTLCASQGIGPEYAKLLKMKNEFFFKRIMFADVKKRYISLALLQEGQYLYDLETGTPGLPEIKGYDFKKNGTKPFVRDFYTNLCMDEILTPKEINPTRVFKKFLNFKELMEKEIRNGNFDFFRQSNVKKPEYYKNPFSTQGVCSILLWNALMPDKRLEFPTDVNIVPIKSLTWSLAASTKTALANQSVVSALDGTPAAVRAVVRMPYDTNKNVDWYRDHYPQGYELLATGIYKSINPLIQHMTLTSIAVPKTMDYELPEYVTALFDIESVINNALNLGIPLLRSIGIQSFKASATIEHVSNMVPI